MFEDKIQDFLRGTSMEACRNTARSRGGLSPALKKEAEESNDCFSLTDPALLPDMPCNLMEIFECRESIRTYSTDPITLKELSTLLWCTQGVKMELSNGKTYRNVPAAGGMHSLETYLFIQRVENLEAGLYRYLPYEHALTQLWLNDSVEMDFSEAFPNRTMVENSAITFAWTSVLDRLSYGYGARALRYAFLDAGHVCENLYLTAQALHAGVCAVGAFDDNVLNCFLGVDAAKECAVYAATVGKV